MRVFEYGSQIAIRDSNIENNVLTVRFPKTAILYLRQTKNTPDFMNICIKVPEASCSYRVPVMKVQRYSLEEIFAKKLFFLIPFHIFVYEKNFSKYESEEKKLVELTNVYEQLVKRLNDCAEAGIISEYVKGTVIAMSKKVLEALTVKYSKVQEGVGKIMGGQILDYEAKRIRNEERVNTERERKRAEEAENRAEEAEAKIKKLEAELARLKRQERVGARE